MDGGPLLYKAAIGLMKVKYIVFYTYKQITNKLHVATRTQG